MSNPARNETKVKDYYSTYTDFYGTNPPVLTISLSDRHDEASLTVTSPQWAARQRGEAVFVPPLPYHRLVERDIIEFGYTRVVDNNPRYSWQEVGGLNPGIPVMPIDPERIIGLWNTAERKALQKLKNQHVNFAQFFAEAHETASLLANTASAIGKALPKVKRGNIVGALKDLGFGRNNRQRQKAARLVRQQGKQIADRLSPEQLGKDVSKNAKTAAGNWLAMSFGWSPLLGDVEGAAELLAERSTQDTKRTRFNVRSVAREKVKFHRVQHYSGERRDDVGFVEQLVLVRLDFMFSSAYLASLSADGLTNPAALAWENLPFSFLADYCFGIGNWLEGLDSSVGKEFIGGSATLFTRFSSRVETRLDVQGVDYFVEGRRYRTLTSARTDRYPYGDFPEATMIALEVKNPLKSSTHVANSLALLASAVDDFLNKK